MPIVEKQLPSVEDALREADRLRHDWPVCGLCASDEKHRNKYANQVKAELNLIALADEVLRLRTKDLLWHDISLY